VSHARGRSEGMNMALGAFADKSQEPQTSELQSTLGRSSRSSSLDCA